MIDFISWMGMRTDEAKRQVPVAHHDIEKWLSSLQLLKKDLEELKKQKVVAAGRLAKIAAIDKKKDEKPKKEEPKKEEKPTEKQIRKQKKKKRKQFDKKLQKQKDKKKDEKS